ALRAVFFLAYGRLCSTANDHAPRELAWEPLGLPTGTSKCRGKRPGVRSAGFSPWSNGLKPALRTPGPWILHSPTMKSRCTPSGGAQAAASSSFSWCKGQTAQHPNIRRRKMFRNLLLSAALSLGTLAGLTAATNPVEAHPPVRAFRHGVEVVYRCGRG